MLKMRLRAGETVIINGAVLRASTRTEITLENRAAILRGREVMKPEQAVSPATTLYFVTMLHYIDAAGRTQHANGLLQHLSQLVAASRTAKGQALCARFARLMAQGEHYAALRICRQLIALERAAGCASEAQAA